MKKVLIVTYSFPPAESACAKRADSFVKQLNKYGWEPLILAGNVKIKSVPAPAGAAGTAAPEGMEIVRTAPWRAENLPTPFRQVAGFFSSLLMPDRERLWELSSIRKAVRLARSAGADLIYTLSPPSSAHLIGMRLKRKNPDIPWVADFYMAADTKGGGLKKIREQYVNNLVDSVMDGADCIITGDPALGDVLNKSRGNAGEQTEICCVPNGHVQELTEQFEKACRVIAARKLSKNNDE
ncbi:MAG: glycosyltransferase family 4 protein [Clostridiaceae bacterium]|jgi:hypothetical protein|nr:glycosyltransferase family 4 protein [Clostridiaceae bacterium]